VGNVDKHLCRSQYARRNDPWSIQATNLMRRARRQEERTSALFLPSCSPHPSC
jgi:hypothetical protein